MRITYTGREQKLSPAQQKKLDAKFAKLSKLIDNRKGEKEAHVVLTSERHLNRAEVTVRFLDHALVGIGANADALTAMTEAVEKIEKQLLKLRAKRRDTYRGSKANWGPAAGRESTETSSGRVFRVDSHRARKPMTLDEAVLEIEDDRDYMVYRDAKTDRLSMLVRRRDGNFDLVES